MMIDEETRRRAVRIVQRDFVQLYQAGTEGKKVGQKGLTG